jgi:hypothetical protein
MLFKVLRNTIFGVLMGEGEILERDLTSDLETVHHILLRLWDMRSSGVSSYDKRNEKPMWTALQRFIEEKGGRDAPVGRYLF